MARGAKSRHDGAARDRTGAGLGQRTCVAVALAAAGAGAGLLGLAPVASATLTSPVWPVLVTSVNVGSVNDIGPTGTATLPVGKSPSGVAVTPDGKYAYVVDRGANALSIIDGPGSATYAY